MSYLACTPCVPLFSSGTNFCTRDFAPPRPEFGPEFWETNFGRPNFGPEFLGRVLWPYFFQEKRPPRKFTVEKFTSQNSPSKIQPRNRAKKTSHCTCAGPFGPCFLIGLEAEGVLDYQGRAGIISIVRWNLRPVIFDVNSLVALRWPDSRESIRRFARIARGHPN